MIGCKGLTSENTFRAEIISRTLLLKFKRGVYFEKMICSLRTALKNNNINKIIEIQKSCNEFISDRMGNVGGDFAIKRDNFCEGNNITDKIKETLLSSCVDRTKVMVAAAR